MLIDKSSIYKSINNENNGNIVLKENFSVIILLETRKICKFLTVNLQNLEKIQNKQYLPGFKNRNLIKNDVNSLKLNLTLNFQRLESFIISIKTFLASRKKRCLCIFIDEDHQKCSMFCFEIYEMNEHVLNNILLSYSRKYHNFISSFRKIQQTHLNRVKKFAVFDELDSKEQNIHKKSFMKQEVILKEDKKIDEINKNLFSLTTTLMEIKNLIYKQDFEIEKIDIHIEKINTNLEKTNKEILKFDEKFDGIKDKSIISLFSVIIFLLLCLFLKHNPHNFL